MEADTVSIVSYAEQKAETTRGVEQFEDDLVEEAAAAQRLVVTRLMKEYTRGSRDVSVPEVSRKMTGEKRFSAPRLIEWTEGNPDVVVDALRMGRVRARVQAAMGTGKTVKLAPYIARTLDMRVLLVSCNGHNLQQVAVYVDEMGIGRYRRSWSRKPGERLSCMTYGDYDSIMCSPNRAELFKCFDVVIFDEAFVPESVVFVAKRLFAVYASAEVSLLLCSATIKEGVDAEAVGSRFMGNFRMLDSDLTLDQAMDSGKLVGDYLVDKTMVLLSTDAEIQRLCEYYSAWGVDTMALDSAPTYEDLRAVHDWLKGDAISPRVVVAHYTFGIEFNFDLAYTIIWPYRCALVVEGDRIVERRIPFTGEMVAQAKARTGRGQAQTSGGIVCSPHRAETVELYEDQKLLAYVMLTAAYVKPMAAGMWAEQHRMFPEGLQPAVAQMLLKVCLPVEVAVRYLASDGYFASRYARALTVYSQPDHFLLPSKESEPVNADLWVEDVREGEHGDVSVRRVPFHAEGELQVVLHAVSAIADGQIEVVRWRPTRTFALGDGYDSEEEERDPRFVRRANRLRRVRDVETRVVEAVEPVEAWSYTGSQTSGPSVRSGVIFRDEGFKSAMRALEAQLENFSVKPVELPEPEVHGDAFVVPVEANMGSVESPGGSVVCKLPVAICEKMNMGRLLTPSEVLTVITEVREQPERFVASRLFNHFSGPWESMLVSLAQEDVIAKVVRRGVANGAYAVVDMLRARFSVELGSVLAHSNVFKRRFLRVFSRTPTAESMMSAIRRGNFDRIAQTQGFIERVKQIKRWIDEALLQAERYAVYLPTAISRAQRVLPLQGPSIVGAIGQGMVPVPVPVQRRLQGNPMRARFSLDAGERASAAHERGRAGMSGADVGW